MKLLYILALSIIVSGCAFYPKAIQHYDSECNISYKQLILKNGSMIGQCTNEACIASILTIPIQALVAGSLVIAGNTAFWLEKEGRCLYNKNTANNTFKNDRQKSAAF